MYHSGDDLGAVVCDQGSCSTRVGFAGDDFPKAYVPSGIGKFPSKDDDHSKNLQFNINYFQENMEIESIMSSDGLIANWDYFEKYLSHLFENSLKTNIAETPFLMTEKTYNSQASRHKSCEVMFESFQTPAYFLAKDSVMELYSCGRTSGIVVDIGGSGTNISPVNDGWVEARGLNQSPISTSVMDAYVLQLIQTKINSTPTNTGSSPLTPLSSNTILPPFRISKNTNLLLSETTSSSSILQPLYEIRKLNNVHPTFDTFMNLQLGRHIKESICRVAESSLIESNFRYSSIPSTLYELPDGRTVDAGIERYMPHELLFDPSVLPVELYPSSSSSSSCSNSSNSDVMDVADIAVTTSSSSSSIETLIATLKSIPHMLVDSVVRCDQDIQSNLLGNIVVAGGGSCVEGLPERIRFETEQLTRNIAPTWRVKAIGSSVNDRVISAWLGGSIVASLGSFHDMWITKNEYQEFGAAIIDKKCP